MSKKILTIDDEEAIRESFKSFLEDHGYQVSTAENGLIGLEVFKQEKPDLILVDLRMPTMDGLDVISNIKIISPDTPIIIVSGTGLLSDAIEAIKLGAWDYLTKPILDLSALNHSIEKAFEKVKLIEDNRRYQTHLESLVEERTKELENAYHKLQEQFDELKLAKEKVEESDRLKTAFLQNLSHEIRTPMNAIMGFSSVLAENYNDKNKLARYSEIIKNRSKDLLDIINDILDISKIELGQISINYEMADLSDIFLELSYFFNEYKKQFENKDVIFIMKPFIDSLNREFYIDKGKLKQILINLISNAFKFTETGSVEIECEFDDNNNLKFVVSDTGIGIPKDKHDIIFERFYRLHNSSVKNIGGTGLGLSIAKGLVNLLGGKIWLDSEIGKGSRFSFIIPIDSAEPFKFETSFISQIDETLFFNKTILIVEDDFYNSTFLEEILGNSGFNIITTEYGNEAVAITLDQQIDLVLMDIRLPDINGYETTKLIRQNNTTIKIIAQTAYAAQSEKKEALNAGCDDYISKPIKRELLFELLKKHLLTH